MNKGIVFFIGLLFGIIVCALFYYFDIKIFETKFIPNIAKEVITRIKTDTVFVEKLPKINKQIVESSFMDSVEYIIEINVNDEDVSIYETNFSFESNEQDEIFSDQLLKTRIVKIKSLKQEVALPDHSFQSFEIQQWSTPVKNKITYQRDQSMLKIKGLEINNANVVFWNNLYYLEVNNHYYLILETEHFEKLNPVNINP
jgi:hypothetical protein